MNGVGFDGNSKWAIAKTRPVVILEHTRSEPPGTS